MELPESLFDRAISRPRSTLHLGVVGATLIALPYVFVALDGMQLDVIRSGLWRNLLVQPIVILYVIIIAPLLARMGEDVVVSFRPLVDLDEQSYMQLVVDANRVPKWHEILAIVVGILLGLLSVSWGMSGEGIRWLFVYWVVSTCAMFGLLAWTVYASFASTRLTSALHRNIKQIDLFDLTPFQAIGRQSLALALTFMGGILLSLIFGTQAQSFMAIEFWISYGIMGMVPVLIFFLNMLPTHRLLSKEKKRRMDELDGRIHHLTRELESLPLDAAIPSDLSLQFSALAAYEQRLLNTRTWPYNTTQLRTVFVSILFPGLTMLVRLFVENRFK